MLKKLLCCESAGVMRASRQRESCEEIAIAKRRCLAVINYVVTAAQ